MPLFSFGETDIYDQVPNPEGSLLRRVQNKLQTVFGLAPCLFKGRGIFQYTWGLVPQRRPITTVGKSFCAGERKKRKVNVTFDTFPGLYPTSYGPAFLTPSSFPGTSPFEIGI